MDLHQRPHLRSLSRAGVAYGSDGSESSVAAIGRRAWRRRWSSSAHVGKHISIFRAPCTSQPASEGRPGLSATGGEWRDRLRATGTALMTRSQGGHYAPLGRR